MQILIIEDDPETGQFLQDSLAEAGHTATLARDGATGFLRASSERWELLIVDRMLPKLDGLTLVHRLRQSGVDTPALMLTTLAGIDDRVQGLNAGADDYLVKPFAFAELLARVAALGRRAHLVSKSTMRRMDDLEMDLLSRTVKRCGRPIDLSPREFRLLEYFMQHADQIVTRAMLLENVWGVHFEPHTSVVETHVSRLRSKVDRESTVALIHTVRGIGYIFRVAG
jgi:two-component system OmpR family response regulator